MMNAHPLHPSEFSDDDAAPSVRLALAGGSDNRPPGDEPGSAEIIRFPIERVRGPDGAAILPPSGDVADTPRKPAGDSPASAGDGRETGLWPAWLAKTLLKNDQPPDGGRSGSPLLTI